MIEKRSLEFMGFPHHFVDSEGSVLTLKIRGTDRLREAPIKMIMNVNASGYYATCIRHNGRSLNVTAHRLVMLAFFGEDKDRPFVNHKDCNKLNNHIDNLEWSTPKENTQHAFANGMVRRKGVSNSQAKLDDIKIVAIKTLMLAGWRNRDIFKHYNVAPHTISSIRTGKAWKHVCGDL